MVDVGGADALGHTFRDGVGGWVLDGLGPLFFVPQVLPQEGADIPRALVGTTGVVKAFAIVVRAHGPLPVGGLSDGFGGGCGGGCSGVESTGLFVFSLPVATGAPGQQQHNTQGPEITHGF